MSGGAQEAQAVQEAQEAPGAQEGAWSISDNDRALLRQVIAALRRLEPLAWFGTERAALGEVVEALERVRDGGSVADVLTLSVGVQDGNEAFSEDWFARLAISPDAIVLDKLNATYTRELGVERLTTSYAVLKPGVGLDDAGVAGWLAELNELRRWSTVEIHCERISL